MKMPTAFTLAVIAAACQWSCPGTAHADDTVSKRQADAFDKHVFSRAPGKKAYAWCEHMGAEDAPQKIRYDGPVNCEGITIALAKANKSAIVRLTRINVLRRDNTPGAGEPKGDAPVAGSDNKIFRLDRTNTAECADLVTDRKELAALRRK